MKQNQQYHVKYPHNFHLHLHPYPLITLTLFESKLLDEFQQKLIHALKIEQNKRNETVSKEIPDNYQKVMIIYILFSVIFLRVIELSESSSSYKLFKFLL